MDKSESNPLEAIARAQVVDVVKRVAARMFVDLVSEREGSVGESESEETAVSDDHEGESAGGGEEGSVRASESLEDEELTLQIGKTMDGYVGKMIRVLEQLKSCVDLDESDLDLDLRDEDIREGERIESSKGSLLDDATSLLRALILFRRVFPSHHIQPTSPMSSSGTLTPTSSTPTRTMPSFLGSSSAIHGNGNEHGNENGNGGARKDSPLLVLSRVLAAPVFDQEAEIEDARDRVVDMLADVKRRRS